MLRVRVDGPDALFQRQQGFVNLRALDSALLVVALAVLRAFTARQVHHQHFSESSRLAFQADLVNRVRARRHVVRAGRLRIFRSGGKFGFVIGVRFLQMIMKCIYMVILENVIDTLVVRILLPS